MSWYCKAPRDCDCTFWDYGKVCDLCFEDDCNALVEIKARDMFENFDNFIYSSEDNFPKDECTIRNVRESGVFESRNVYLVLWIDIRFPNDKNITYAKPYIWRNEHGEVYYGWSALSSNMVFGNVENSCQLYDEFVVGFIHVDGDFIKRDEELFNEYKQTIEEQ